MANHNAIPTIFNGTEYRSRLEADTARLLTLLEIPFEYEAVSYLLPSGVHYWPDFLLHGRTQALEVRGYRSPHGDKQLREFAQFVAGGGLGQCETFFAVLSPEPIVEAVNAIHYSPGCAHGALFCPDWNFDRFGRSPWAMNFNGARNAALRGWDEESDPHCVQPIVSNGLLCVERWQESPPHECLIVPVRDIDDPADLLAY